jgi:hypothetical protein
MAAAAAAALLLGGCASLRAQNARSTYLAKELAEYQIPRLCKDIWPDALKVVAGHDFPLVGDDRTHVGMEAQGWFGSFFSKGHQTHRVGEDGLESETDYGKTEKTIRYRVNCRSVGTAKDKSRVTFTALRRDEMDSGREFLTIDYEMALELLYRVDPDAARKLDDAADEAGNPKR